jgi:Helix-turn-helix domain
MNEHSNDTSPRYGRWGTVAASVMRRPGLSVAAKAVYTVLATYTDRHGWSWVRQDTLAADLGRSRAWVHAAVAELEEQRIISHDRQFIEGRQRASRYRLIDGLARCAADQAAGQGWPDPSREPAWHRETGEEARVEVSEKTDAAVEPADTGHQDDNQIKDSLSDVRGKDFSDNRDFQQTGEPEVGDTGRNPDPGNRICAASAPEAHRRTVEAGQAWRAGRDKHGGSEFPDAAAGNAQPPIILPEDWRPNEADTAWAVARVPGLDVESFTENFILSCRAKGYRYANIHAAWRRWLTEPKGSLPMINSINRDARENHDRSAEGHFRNRHDFGQQDAGGARGQRADRDAGRRAKPGAGETRLAAWASAASRRSQARAFHG